MTNAELINLSIEELRDLNKRAIEVIKIKQQTASFINKEKLTNGMLVEYLGNSKYINYKTFEIMKIKRTKAECKCVVTGVHWNIQIGNLKKL